MLSMHTMMSNRKMVSMGMVLGGGYFEEFRNSNGCMVCNLCVYANGIKKKTNNYARKNKNERVQMGADNSFATKCMLARNKATTTQ